MRTIPISLIIFSVIMVTACHKDQEIVIFDPDSTSAGDNALAEDVFNDLLYQVDKAAFDNGLRELCDPTVTFDTTSTPRTMILDFGTENCTTSDGRLRRGRIEVVFNGPYGDVGTTIVIGPVNYFVNNNQVEGTITRSNWGPDENGDRRFQVNLFGYLFAPDLSWRISHSEQRIRTWIAGDDTPDLSDDVHSITGSGSGVNRNGVSFSVLISSALRVALNCPFITQGTLQIFPGDRPVRTIDFGDGSCDANFTVSVNGQTFNGAFD